MYSRILLEKNEIMDCRLVSLLHGSIVLLLNG